MQQALCVLEASYYLFQLLNTNAALLLQVLVSNAILFTMLSNDAMICSKGAGKHASES